MPKRDLTAKEVIQLAKIPGKLHRLSTNLYLDTRDGRCCGSSRHFLNGREINIGLGAYGLYSLAEWRETVRQHRRQVREGIHPAEQRRAEKLAKALEAAKAVTFRQCAEACIKAKSAGWRNAVHARQWPTTLETYVYPVIGDLSLQSIDTGLVMTVLEPIWDAKPETASRVRGRIESVLDYGTARGWRQGENVARWRGHLESLLSEKSKARRVAHHPALPYAELADFMVELRRLEGVSARALRFTILTAARSGEVLGARWPEINFSERVWVVPGSRMKSGREHRVPLSDAAITILEQMQRLRVSDFVFPGGNMGRALKPSAMLKPLRRMGRTDIVVHGFRSTFADWCTEATNFPTEVREMALAHVVGSKVEQAYRRSDLFQRRRELADAWARYCSEPAPENNVVPIAGNAGRG